MKYFTQLDYPIYDLETELTSLLKSGVIDWSNSNQICVNGVEDDPTNQSIGCGSLNLDWDNSYKDDTGTLIIPKKDIVYKETDFNTFNPTFSGTIFEYVHNMLSEKHTIGRMRLMRSMMKTCLSWHTDRSPRLHYPIKTSTKCRMVIEDETIHMPVNTWWHTDTTRFHSAFNGSTDDRIHLVIVLLD